VIFVADSRRNRLVLARTALSGPDGVDVLREESEGCLNRRQVDDDDCDQGNAADCDSKAGDQVGTVRFSWYRLRNS